MEKYYAKFFGLFYVRQEINLDYYNGPFWTQNLLICSRFCNFLLFKMNKLTAKSYINAAWAGKL